MKFFKNARVCFIGDSLTGSNQYLFHIIDFYNKQLKKDNIKFFNCGIPGGTCKTAIEYFQEDIMRHNPTHAVVAFGVNDSGYGVLSKKMETKIWNYLEKRFEEFKENIKTLYEMLKSNNISVIWCTPAPYDEYSEHETSPLAGESAVLANYAEYVRAFARKNGIPLCDYHAYLSRELRTGTQLLYRPDRVHPNEDGYYFMAKCLLAFLGYEIGEKKEMPEYLNDWHNIIQIIRRIYAIEIMYPKSMPIEEKISSITEQLKVEKIDNEYIFNAMNAYVKYRIEIEKLYSQADAIYEKDVLNLI